MCTSCFKNFDVVGCPNYFLVHLKFIFDSTYIYLNFEAVGSVPWIVVGCCGVISSTR